MYIKLEEIKFTDEFLSDLLKKEINENLQSFKVRENLTSLRLYSGSFTSEQSMKVLKHFDICGPTEE